MKQKMDKDGIIKSGKLNEIIEVITSRKNGSVRIQQDFEFCPTMAEQHTAHLSDINHLMERYKPDELAAYIAARTQYRKEIVGHDFSKEPDLQEANNIVYRSRKEFEELDPEVRQHFKNHIEFLKFVDNPQNVEKLIKLGLVTKKQIENIQIPEDKKLMETPNPITTPTTTKEEKKEDKK